jgi:hypothetical protein
VTDYYADDLCDDGLNCKCGESDANCKICKDHVRVEDCQSCTEIDQETNEKLYMMSLEQFMDHHNLNIEQLSTLMSCNSVYAGHGIEGGNSTQ